MNTMNTDEKKRKTRRVVSARAKAQAVLAVWSGRRKASQICRELGVNWGSLNGWERKGLQGIHRAMGGEELTLPAREDLGQRLEKLMTGLSAEKLNQLASTMEEKQA